MSDAETLIVGRLLDFERSAERFVILSVALLVPCFALVGVVAAFSTDGPRPVLRLALAGAIFVTTIPVGLAMTRLAPQHTWWHRPTSFWHPEAGFVVYADLGVTGVLCTFANPEAAMYGAALFAVIGNYASHIATGRWLFIGHVGVASVVIVMLGVLTWRQGGHDTAGVVARVLTSLIVISSATLVYVFTCGLRRILDRRFDEAARDPLTGLLNRRGFATLVEDILIRRRAVSFIVLDVDHFKRVNDDFGHAAGDEVLKLLGERLRRTAGGATFVARTGGEEFALAVEHDGIAVELAERIRSAAGNAADGVPITVSVGVNRVGIHDVPRQPSDPARLLCAALRTADAAMYEAKAAGGNRVVSRLRA